MEDNTELFSGLSFWAQAGISLLVMGVSLVLSLVLSRIVFPRVIRRVNADRHPMLSTLLNGFRKPISLLLLVLSVCAGLLVFTSSPPPGTPAFIRQILSGLPAFLGKTARVSAIIAVSWGMLASNGVSTLFMRKARKTLNWDLSKSVINFITAVFNVIVVIIALFALLTEFGFDVYTLLAGLGIGGLTVALAAQDSASNFFGGLVIIFEKPFEIGDRIVCAEVEGTVEDINLRSTKVRTDDGSLTIVPNAKISGAAITNWSGVMKQRRADVTLSLSYNTTKEQLRAFNTAVRTMLETDPEIVGDSVLVRFTEFGQSALSVRVVFYTTLPGYSDYMRIRERVNYALFDIAKANHIRFAYPAMSVYLSNPSSKPDDTP